MPEVGDAIISTHGAILSPDDIALRQLGSPGAVRHSSPSLDRRAELVPGPPAAGGALVPPDGPRSGSERDSPLVEEGEAAALAVVVSSCQYSRPDLRSAADVLSVQCSLLLFYECAFTSGLVVTAHIGWLAFFVSSALLVSFFILMSCGVPCLATCAVMIAKMRVHFH